MTYATASINPFYAARLRRASPVRPPEPDRPVYARLPRAPITGSPVPHLTSLYHFHRAGEYGDRRWPGNCGGNLIKDLLTYFQPGLVFDPMTGSGTASDVCEELGIPCMAWDIHQGFDACDPKDFPPAETFDFIWAHPPYWRMKLYADDPRDLSRSPTLEHSCGATASSSATAPAPETRRQARHPHGRLFRPRGRIRAAGLPHQAAGLRRRADASTAPTSSVSATAPAAARRSTAAASSPACTTSA